MPGRRSRRIWPREFYKVAAWFYTVVAIVSAPVAWQFEYQPQTDFDIIGVLFIMQNLPVMFFWGIFFISLCCAIYCWARTAAMPPSGS